MIDDEEKIQLHVDIGLMLISNSGRASRDVIEELFSFAVSHINMALPKTATCVPAVPFTSSQNIVFAKLNLKGGQKAVNGKLDFPLAENHLRAAVAFLPPNSWANHYVSLSAVCWFLRHDMYTKLIISCMQCSPLQDLTLQIYDEYVQVLYVTRNFDEMHVRINAILENAKCIGEKIKAHEIFISASIMKGSTPEALKHATSVLESLGFPFPASVNREAVAAIASSLSSTVMAFTPDQLREMPVMTETVPLQAMKIMSTIHMLFSLSSPIISRMMACQMIQLTIKHGLCVQSAPAFANFGYSVNSMFRDYEVGFRIGKLSLVILERFKATKLTAKVYTLVYGFLSVWKEPIQATVEGLQSGINTGFIEGDTSNVNGARIIKYRQMLIAGFNLATVRDGLLRLCQDLVRRLLYSSFVFLDLQFAHPSILLPL